MTSQLRHSVLQRVRDACTSLSQQCIFQQDGVPAHAAKMTQQWLASCCMQLTFQTLLTKTPVRQIARTWICLTIVFGDRCCKTSVTWIRSRRTSQNWSQRLWRSGTSYQGCSQQVDREFQEVSASLCKRRWRTFWAFTVTLLIDLTYVCCFLNFESKNMLENVVIN